MDELTFTDALPHCSGWWHWKETEYGRPVRLLIAGNERHTEVATTSSLCAALGLEYHGDDEEMENNPEFPGNYWEMTACREMRGQWALEEAFDFQN